MEKKKIVLYSEVIGAIVDVIINMMLIPKLASTGAAIGTVIAELAVLIVQYSVLRNEVGGTLKKPYYIKINIAVLLACLVSCWVKVLGTGEFITLIVSAILYFGVYGLVLLVTKEEMVMEVWQMVMKWFRKLCNKH